MNNLETFNDFFDDVMIQKMSVHAFGMYAKGLIMNLQATIEAQEIIIKDKSAIMEAMAQHKTCEGCTYKSTMNNWCIKFDIKVHAGFCCNSYEPKVQP